MRLDTLPDRLRGSADWSGTARRLERRLLRRPQDAIEAAGVLGRDLDLHGDDLAVSAVRQSLFSIVCRARSSEATAIAYRLAAAPGRPHPHHPQLDPADARGRRAMELSATRPTPEVHALLDGADLLDTDPEFGLLLLHELVLRRKGLPRSAARYSDWAVRSDHPLASLPLRLLELEVRLPDAMVTFGPDPYGSHWSPVGIELSAPVPLRTLLPGLGPTLDGDESGIHGLFRDWGVEGYAVDVQRRPHGSAFPTLSERPSPTDRTQAQVVDLDAVLGAMFSAAAGAGAYTHGPGGAWSRLRVWRAVASIIGATWPTPIDAIARHATSWRWIGLAIDHEPWFSAIAWDFWCLADSGELVVGVAATDSD